MIEPRLYRLAFAPALFAVVLAMFSLENRPPALPQGLAADVLFDGRVAARELGGLVRRTPDRAPGSIANRALAASVADRLRAHGFKTVEDRFEASGKRLVNVVGRRAGTSRRQVVVLTARDSTVNPDATGSAADTAALLELARALQGRAARKTLVLASVDGATLGQAGTRRFADTVVDRDRIDAVLVLSDSAARHERGALVSGWANDSSRAGIGLERTAVASLRSELARVPAGSSVPAQLFRLAIPLGVGPQGVLLEQGIDSVRISGSGELPPPRPRRGLRQVDAQRLGELGRAALRTVSALDGARPEHGPRSYVLSRRKVVPGWSVVLLAVTLLLPAVVASVDAFARARRRREPVAPWWTWLGGWTIPWLCALALAELLVVAGAAPDLAAAAPVPDDHPLDGAAGGILAGVTAAAGLGWYLARPLVRSPRASTGDGDQTAGAGAATSLALAALALVVLVLNPFAALLLVPAAHAWMLLCLSPTAPPRMVGALLVLGGLALPVAACGYFMVSFDLHPLEAAWYGFLLVTGHQIGLFSALLGCALLAVTAAVVSIALARSGHAPEPKATPAQRLRGPGGYAGPGSLGGTESALRR